MLALRPTANTELVIGLNQLYFLPQKLQDFAHESTMNFWSLELEHLPSILNAMHLNGLSLSTQSSEK